jgi:hypothetical protein
MGQVPSSPPRLVFPIYHMESHIVVRALEYISQKLCKKGLHVHLIVAGDALSCLLFKSRPTTFVYPPLLKRISIVDLIKIKKKTATR